MYQRKNLPIFAAALISLLVIVIAYKFVTQPSPEASDSETEQSDTIPRGAVRDIMPDDHVLGNPQADIVLYVYSDFSCPFCDDYHKTLRTLMNYYGTEGNVAYVYRQMPFIEIHPNAPMYALASECVAREGGNAAFWAYADSLFDAIDPVETLDASGLVQLAHTVGVSKQAFAACMKANTLMKDVQEDYNEGKAAGAVGTPFTVVQTPTEYSILEGAQSLKSLAYALKTAAVQFGHENDGDAGGMQDTIQLEDFDTVLAEPATTATTSTSTATSTVPGTQTKPPESPQEQTEDASILDGIVD